MEKAFEPASPPNQKRNWVPLLVGLVTVIVAVGAIVLFTRHKTEVGTQPNPYAEKLKLSAIKRSARTVRRPSAAAAMPEAGPAPPIAMARMMRRSSAVTVATARGRRR